MQTNTDACTDADKYVGEGAGTHKGDFSERARLGQADGEREWDTHTRTKMQLTFEVLFVRGYEVGRLLVLFALQRLASVRVWVCACVRVCRRWVGQRCANFTCLAHAGTLSSIRCTQALLLHLACVHPISVSGRCSPDGRRGGTCRDPVCARPHEPTV